LVHWRGNVSYRNLSADIKADQLGTRWNSQRQNPIWPVCPFDLFINACSYLDLVDEYHQYANAELDDEVYEVQEEGGGEEYAEEYTEE
jgi:hypothetical protein